MKKKIKAKRNVAKKVETNPNDISNLSSEDLGLLLHEQDKRLMDTYSNINLIKAELNKRKSK